MGMSTHVVAFKPPNEKWRKMKEVWDACEKAGVQSPLEVTKFFEHDAPDEAGVRIDQHELTRCGAVKEWGESSREGFEIDVSKLPPDVTVIRFYNSY